MKTLKNIALLLFPSHRTTPVEHVKGEAKTFGTAVSMLQQQVKGGGEQQHCDLSFTFMLYIFYVSRSVVAFGRVFEFFLSFSVELRKRIF